MSRWPRPPWRCCRSPTRCRSRSREAASLNEEVRLKYRYLDIRRADMAAALRARSKAVYLLNQVMDAHRFVNGGDAVPDAVHPRGRPRLPRAGPAAAGLLVRAAAVAAAVQAAADDRRPGALLPARAVLPRRGLPRRQAARVHSGRPRDVLRHPGGRGRGRRGPDRGAVARRSPATRSSARSRT